MKKIWYLPLLVTLLLTACGQEEQVGAGNMDKLTPIDVELSVPETAEIGESVIFSSAVTQGEDLVDDANEVGFEIWLEGEREQSDLIVADRQDGHVYFIEYAFAESGIYHVQTHVTARGLHRMPTAQIQVGDAEENNDRQVDVHQHQHQHSDVNIEKVLKKDRLIISVEVDGSPYKGGRVALEMSENKEEQAKWIDLIEGADGQYVLSNIDDFSGMYYAILHIEDDNIHEHVDIELNF
ncbi:FixH family protein [Alkalihalobacillus deserti]|uniref:FixH family protein n=1 Tax=Alkalihalobacillus deserti TaxID=2879466 RepID=UPI001D14EE12|nr:FixH family protein [Alkalihalobacillus deserti]